MFPKFVFVWFKFYLYGFFWQVKNVLFLFYTNDKESESCLTAPICGVFASQLWKELRPDTPLNGRISKQWCEIGFQGSDPKTDFRGMGLLGLHNLL